MCVPTGFDLYTPRCRILANSTVLCDQDIYRNFDEWQAHRERIEEMIKEYKKALDDLRVRIAIINCVLNFAAEFTFVLLVQMCVNCFICVCILIVL